jgi:hypothetical protein
VPVRGVTRLTAFRPASTQVVITYSAQRDARGDRSADQWHKAAAWRSTMVPNVRCIPEPSRHSRNRMGRTLWSAVRTAPKRRKTMQVSSTGTAWLVWSEPLQPRPSLAATLTSSPRAKRRRLGQCARRRCRREDTPAQSSATAYVPSRRSFSILGSG